MTQTLKERYKNHIGKISDKWEIYLDVYQRVFGKYVDRPINLFEIGIQNGGSLEIWAKHFPRAQHLVGCDIDPNCALLRYADPRIAVVVSNANSDSAEAQIAQYSATFDIIIDDGSHVSGDIIRSFARYFPRLAEDGVFIAEDLHCSYWREFDGGLFDPFSSIAFFKRLVDVTNHEHWGVGKTRSDVVCGFFAKYECVIEDRVLSTIHSVEFINSVCVVRKAPRSANELGRRIFAGTDDLVSSDRLGLPAGKNPAPDQSTNRWSILTAAPEESFNEMTRRQIEQDAALREKGREIEAVSASLAAATRQIEHQTRETAAVRMQLVESTRHCNDMTSSLSWRLTRPLRYLRRFGRRS